jgi:hypothetical protein
VAVATSAVCTGLLQIVAGIILVAAVI